jgi:hypothetical protein
MSGIEPIFFKGTISSFNLVKQVLGRYFILIHIPIPIAASQPRNGRIGVSNAE